METFMDGKQEHSRSARGAGSDAAASRALQQHLPCARQPCSLSLQAAKQIEPQLLPLCFLVRISQQSKSEAAVSPAVQGKAEWDRETLPSPCHRKQDPRGLKEGYALNDLLSNGLFLCNQRVNSEKLPVWFAECAVLSTWNPRSSLFPPRLIGSPAKRASLQFLHHVLY